MHRVFRVLSALALCTLFGLRSDAFVPAVIEPQKADADFALQGEYFGEVRTDKGNLKIGVQVIALGGGIFRAVGHHGGLPGDGWNGGEKIEVEGKVENGEVDLKAGDGKATLKKGEIVIADENGNMIGSLKKTERTSPTMGAKAPPGAVVLFDGKNADKWTNGRVENGELLPGTTSNDQFGSHKLHLEFKLPYQPDDRGQQRGNSGIYLQGRYEVQMLDSFGLAGEHNECGGIYSVKKPDVNMCLPPLAWQTYDIEYTAAKYDKDGKIIANPRVTVQHNGVIIHKDVELPGDRVTTAAPNNVGPSPGPVYLQDHGNPVRYRNVWVLATK